MATINFVNDTLIAGTTANPGLEDVLSATGAVTASTASLFEITNTSGGQFNGFRFQLTSSASDFTYGGTTPTGGTIDGITVLAPDGTTHIVEVTALGGVGAEQSLAIFFAVLNDPDLGPLFALDLLLNSEDTVNGSGVADHATAFGFVGGDFDRERRLQRDPHGFRLVGFPVGGGGKKVELGTAHEKQDQEKITFAHGQPFAGRVWNILSAAACPVATQSGMPTPRKPLPVTNSPGWRPSLRSMAATRSRWPTSCCALARTHRYTRANSGSPEMPSSGRSARIDLRRGGSAVGSDGQSKRNSKNPPCDRSPVSSTVTDRKRCVAHRVSRWFESWE
jgi:hypothetical protein